ncbi:MAG TPA: 3-keto-5-aminohexanoate cleavage protein [Ilumatobacteraceae bacterium]|nr:3-keto-5-aminohexanoate cleavage protein [Ilumatobacteraceae bacterium]
MNNPVIIEAAINGTVTPDQNPHVPRTPDEIAEQALACFAAGAAIVHNHNDQIGMGTAASTARYLEGWRLVWAERPEALIYPTINVVDGKTNYDHLELLAAEGLRIGLCDPGSVNLGGASPSGPSGGFVYANSFDTIGATFDLHTRCGLGPSLAIYEPGFLRTVVAFQRAGRLPAGSMVKLYFSTDRGLYGAPFGLPPTPTALDAYLEILDGTELPWAVSVVGGDVVASKIAAMAIERGGHLHLGLEFYGGERTPTNVELVNEAVALVESMGRRPASTAETVALLDLPQR